MELGTAIFLSSVFLGLVFLYIATKDRWRWRLWGRRALAASVTIAIIGGGWLYISRVEEDRLVPQAELWGIQLGQTAADVKFAKGTPAQKLEEKGTASWFYSEGDGLYHVMLLDQRVRAIFYDGKRLSAPDVLGLNGYSSLDDVTRKLGQPSRIERSADETARTFYFDRYQVAFEFTAGSVTSIGIYNPSRTLTRYSP